MGAGELCRSWDVLDVRDVLEPGWFRSPVSGSGVSPCCRQVNANGSVMSSDIVGSIKLKTMLSGMPELRLGLNDRVLFALTGRKCAAFAAHASRTPPLTPASVLRSGDKGKTVMMEDVKFHQCVRLSRFESDRTISFIPPDGESELMSYRINTHVSKLV